MGRSDLPNGVDRLDTTIKAQLQWTIMERNCAASGQVAILQLDLAEIQGLHSFLALGAHYFWRT